MASNEDTEFTLDDHQNKCRCCFRALMDKQKSVKITKSIEEKFFALTQIQVFGFEALSKMYLNVLSLAAGRKQ